MVGQVQGSGGGAPQADFGDFDMQSAGMPPAAEGQQCGGPKQAGEGGMPGEVKNVANPSKAGEDPAKAGEDPAKGGDVAAKIIEQVNKMLEPIMKKLEEIGAAIKKLAEGDKAGAPAGNAQQVSNQQGGDFSKADVDELRAIAKDLSAAAGEPPKDAGAADPAAGDKKGGVQKAVNKNGAEPANDANADPAAAKPADAKPADAKKDDPLSNLNAAVDRLNKWMDKHDPAAGKDGGDAKQVSNPTDGAGAKDGLPPEVKKMLGDLAKDLNALADTIEKSLPKDGANAQNASNPSSDGMCSKRDDAALDPFRQKELAA